MLKKYFFIFLFVFVPSLSFASQFPTEFVAPSDFNFFPTQADSPLLSVKSGVQLVAPLAGAEYDAFRYEIYAADTAYSLLPTPPQSCLSAVTPSPIDNTNVNVSILSDCRDDYPTADFIFLNLYAVDYADPQDTALLLGYAKWQFEDSVWKDTLDQAYGQTNTRISSFSPALNETINPGSITLLATGFLDGFAYETVSISIVNNDTLTSYDWVSAPTSGNFTVSKDFVFVDGLHQGTICLPPKAGFSGSICKNLSFVVGESALTSPYQPVDTTSAFCEGLFPIDDVSIVTATITTLPNALCNMGFFLFVPNQSALTQFTSIDLSDRAPFSYVYDINDLRQDLFNPGSSGSGVIQVPFASFGTLTLLSGSQVAAFPLSSSIKSILSALILFFMAEYIYRKALKIFN